MTLKSYFASLPPGQQANILAYEGDDTIGNPLLARGELGIRMLCAWNNIPRDKAKPEWSTHLNESTRDAWERVAFAAIEFIDEVRR